MDLFEHSSRSITGHFFFLLMYKSDFILRKKKKKKRKNKFKVNKLFRYGHLTFSFML